MSGKHILIFGNVNLKRKPDLVDVCVGMATISLPLGLGFAYFGFIEMYFYFVAILPVLLTFIVLAYVLGHILVNRNETENILDAPMDDRKKKKTK